MKRLTTRTYDLAGNSFWRVVRLNVFNKIFPVGNFRQGVGGRPALVLTMLHLIGRPVFNLIIRYEHPLHRLYQKLRKGR